MKQHQETHSLTMAFWLILQHSNQATGQIRKYGGQIMSNLIAEFKFKTDQSKTHPLKLNQVNKRQFTVNHVDSWWIPQKVTAHIDLSWPIRLFGGGGIGHQLEMPRGQQELCGHGGWGTGHPIDPIPIPASPWMVHESWCDCHGDPSDH